MQNKLPKTSYFSFLIISVWLFVSFCTTLHAFEHEHAEEDHHSEQCQVCHFSQVQKNTSPSSGDFHLTFIHSWSQQLSLETQLFQLPFLFTGKLAQAPPVNS